MQMENDAANHNTLYDEATEAVHEHRMGGRGQAKMEQLAKSGQLVRPVILYSATPWWLIFAGLKEPVACKGG